MRRYQLFLIGPQRTATGHEWVSFLFCYFDKLFYCYNMIMTNILRSFVGMMINATKITDSATPCSGWHINLANKHCYKFMCVCVHENQPMSSKANYTIAFSASTYVRKCCKF
ncbi:hypothetical protein Y032_0006g3027 [Ancylostoma ceylanicum]|uniref:Uncharacterized protein n=1 Tax=Ancylostoma ceylanicum TaxID=53326 RepID=A0A016VRB2_9BILA|nr:hypothetical protein Y032_0006g3027 [Ancylostoma ceylanicum]